MVTSFCTKIMKLLELMKVPGQSLRAYGYILLHKDYEVDGMEETQLTPNPPQHSKLLMNKAYYASALQ
jgi:hypothetical protein